MMSWTSRLRYTVPDFPMNPTEYLGRKELFELLREKGLTAYEVKKLIAEEVIVSRPFRPGGAKYFHWPTVCHQIFSTKQQPNGHAPP